MPLSPAEKIAVRSAIAAADNDMLLSRDEVALALDMSVGGVSNAVLAGRLPSPIRIGSRKARPRWRLGDIRDFIKPREVA